MKRFDSIKINLKKSCDLFLNNENIIEKEKNLNRVIFPCQELIEEVRTILKKKRVVFDDKSIKKNAKKGIVL